MKRWSKRLSRLRGVRRGGSVVGLAGRKEWLEDAEELLENAGVFRTISVARLSELLEDEDQGPRELFETQDGRTVRVVDEKNDKQVVVVDGTGRSRQTVVKAKLRIKPRERWTLSDVRDFVVREQLTGAESFADICEDLDSATVEESFVGALVIHAGKHETVLRDLLDALVAHYEGHELENMYVWIDIFAEPANADWTGDKNMKLVKDMPRVIPRFDEVLLHVPSATVATLPAARFLPSSLPTEASPASSAGLDAVLNNPLALWQLYSAVQQKALFAVAMASAAEKTSFVAKQLAMSLRITTAFSSLASETLLEVARDLVPGGPSTVDEAAGRPIEDWLMRNADETMRELRGRAYLRDHGKDELGDDEPEDDGGPDDDDDDESAARARSGARREIVDATAGSQLASLLESSGGVLLRRGAVEEAMARLTEAVALREDMDGPCAATTLSATIGLGRCQAAAGQLTMAQRTLDDALGRADAETDAKTRGRALLALGLVLHRAGALHEALGALTKALLMLDPNDAFERTERIEIVLAIAAVLNELARPEEAILVFDQALDAVRASDGMSSLDGARAFCAVVTQKAEVLRGQGLLADSLEVLDDAVAEVRGSCGSVPGLVDLLSAAAETLEELAYFSEAQERYEEAVRLTLAVDPVNRQALGLLTQLGRLLASTGQSSLALEKLGAAHELALKHFGKTSLELAEVRAILGTVLLSMGDHERASQELQGALGVMRRIRGHSSLEVADVLDSLGSLCLAQGDLVRARGYLKNAHGVVCDILGADHDRAVQLEARLTSAGFSESPRRG